MSEQVKTINTKKDAKAFLVGRNQAVHREEMTPTEKAIFMCDHLHENGKTALVPFKNAAGNVEEGKFRCTYCNEVFSILPVHNTELTKSTSLILDVIQQLKIITPLSDSSATGVAGVMFFLKNLSAMYRNANKDANTSNRAFEYMAGKGKGSNMTGFYNKYSGRAAVRAPK